MFPIKAYQRLFDDYFEITGYDHNHLISLSTATFLRK